MIGIFLLVDGSEFIAGNVDALARRIESHVVGHFGGGQGSNDLAGFRIQNGESRRLAPGNKNTPIGLVKNERRVSVEFAQRPR